MATLSGLSRIQDNKHYLSDVIFGATLGIAVGKGFGHVYRQNRKLVQIRVIPFQQTLSISMDLYDKNQLFNKYDNITIYCRYDEYGLSNKCI